IMEVATEEIPARTRVWTSFDHWDPGAETGRHTHPGPTVFVLLEGELEETLADGRTRTLTAGQGYWKPAGTAHNGPNRAVKPAHALAVHSDPRCPPTATNASAQPAERRRFADSGAPRAGQVGFVGDRERDFRVQTSQRASRASWLPWVAARSRGRT